MVGSLNGFSIDRVLSDSVIEAVRCLLSVVNNPQGYSSRIRYSLTPSTFSPMASESHSPQIQPSLVQRDSDGVIPRVMLRNNSTQPFRGMRASFFRKQSSILGKTLNNRVQLGGDPGWNNHMRAEHEATEESMDHML